MRLNPFYRAIEGADLRRGVGIRNRSTRRRLWIAVFVRFSSARVFRVLLIGFRGSDAPDGPRFALSVSVFPAFGPWGPFR